MPAATIFGAGNIGRGFIGHLLHDSGYEVTFVDVDVALLKALRERGEYRIRLVTGEHSEEIVVGIVDAVDARDQDAVAQAVAEADLMATAVGVRALPSVAPAVAAGITLRAEKSIHEPLNLIVCENLKNAADTFRAMVRGHMAEVHRGYFDRSVGFVDTVIARMVPIPAPKSRQKDPLLIVAEPYSELPVDRNGFIGPPPQVEGMIPADHFAAYVDRKLYVHNAGHAMLGYLGHLRGHEFGHQALVDPEIHPLVAKAMHESCRGLAGRHGWDLSELGEHVEDLLRRFANRALADTVNRLARDPIRKLSPTGRLVGAARMVLEEGVMPVALSWGIGAALLFNDGRDPVAVDLQEQIASEGVAAVLERVSHVRRDGPLGRMVLERYRHLVSGEAW